NRIASMYDGPMLTSHLHQIIIDVIGQCLKRIEFDFLSQGRLLTFAHALSPFTRVLCAAWHSPALIPQLLTLLLVERHWIVVADPTGVHPIIPSARRYWH